MCGLISCHFSVSLTDSDTAMVPRISRELQATRWFCIERIKQNKIDDIIVSKGLACVCLLVFFHKRVCSRKAIDTRASDEERAFWTKYLQNS